MWLLDLLLILKALYSLFPLLQIHSFHFPVPLCAFLHLSHTRQIPPRPAEQRRLDERAHGLRADGLLLRRQLAPSAGGAGPVRAVLHLAADEEGQHAARAAGSGER